MAGRAGAGAAAQAADVETVLADDFHDPPALDSVELVAPAVLVDNAESCPSRHPFAHQHGRVEQWRFCQPAINQLIFNRFRR